MKVNNVLVIILILIGTSVGLISIYTASFTGVMGKMGLVGGDFSQEIDRNAIARQMREWPELDCSMWATVHDVPNYLISKAEGRVSLAGQLGEQRLLCGIGLVQRGNIERGVYSIIKGLYYIKSHYSEMKLLVNSDREKCNLLVKSDYEGNVQGYLRATSGRVHDIVFDLYKQVEREKVGVEELCID